MSPTYNVADKSLWDDSDLLRLYDEQLKLDTEQRLAKNIPVGNSFLDGKSDSRSEDEEGKEREGSGSPRLPSATPSSFSEGTSAGEERELDMKKERNALKNDYQTSFTLCSVDSIRLPFSFSSPLENSSSHPIWKSLQPLLKAYYDAGYAAGLFSGNLQKEAPNDAPSAPLRKRKC